MKRRYLICNWLTSRTFGVGVEFATEDENEWIEAIMNVVNKRNLTPKDYRIVINGNTVICSYASTKEARNTWIQEAPFKAMTLNQYLRGGV